MRPQSGLRRASGSERQKKPDSGHLGLDQAVVQGLARGAAERGDVDRAGALERDGI